MRYLRTILVVGLLLGLAWNWRQDGLLPAPSNTAPATADTRTLESVRNLPGGHPPREFWYTDDHYASFRRFEVPR